VGAVRDVGSPATIFITDGSAPAGALREKCAAWTVAGLIGDSWWVDGASLRAEGEDGAGPSGVRLVLTISATKLDREGQHDVALLGSLGERAHDVYRLVVVHMVTTDRGSDTRRVNAVDLAVSARSFAEQFRQNLPATSEFAALNVVVPVSGVGEIDPAILQDGWRANIVVSPEDEVDDGHNNVGVVHPGNFVSHAALNLATIAGLWEGLEAGPFDESVASADGAPDPITVRAFARVMRGEVIVEEVAASAIQEASATGWDLPADENRSEGPLEAQNPASVLADAVQGADRLDDGSLLFKEATQLPGRTVEARGLISTILLMFAYFGRALIRAPEAAVGRLRRSVAEIVENRATELTFGDEGLYVARLDGELADRDGTPKPQVDTTAAEADRILRLFGAQNTVGPTPGLWQSLRRFCFGIIDGSELPPELDVPTVGARRQLVTRPDLIVVDPEDDYFELVTNVVLGTGLSRWSGVRINTCDCYLASRLGDDLAETLAHIEADAGADPSPDDRRVMEQLDGELARLRTWVARRAPTFLWQLGDEVAGQLKLAVDTMRNAQPIVVAGWSGIDFDEPARRLGRLRRTWLFTLLGVVVALALFWGWERVRPDALKATPVIIAIGLVIAFVSFQRYIRAIWRWEATAARLIVQYKQAVLDLHAGSRETARLGAVYQQFVDWAEIIGWVIHHPWERHVADAGDERTPSVERAQAVRLGSGRPTSEHLQRIGARARRILIHTGWLSEHYEQAALQAETDAALGRGLHDEQRPDADLDTPFQPNGARSELLQALRSKTPQQAGRARAFEQVSAFCSTLSPADVFRGVTIMVQGVAVEGDVADFLAVLPPPNGAQSFARGLWDAQGLVAGAANVKKTSVWTWGPTDVAQSHLEILTTASTVDTDGAYIARSVRLDRSDRTSSSGYTIFAQPQRTPTPDWIPETDVV